MTVRTPMPEDMAADIRRAVMAAARAPRVTEPGATHYKCPDCFAPCACSGFARVLPHARCGLTR